MTISANDLRRVLGEDVEITDNELKSIQLMVEEAVQERIAEYVDEIKNQYQAVIDELKEEINEKDRKHVKRIIEATNSARKEAEVKINQAIDKIDAYLQYVVERFIEDHKRQLVETEEYKRMQNVMSEIKAVFERAFFRVEPTDLIEQVKDELNEVKEEYDRLYEKYRQAVRENKRLSYRLIFDEMTRNLTESDKERIKSIMENVSFKDVEQFRSGLKTIIERLNEGKKTPRYEIHEKATVNGTKNYDDQMKRYLSAL